ncbi:putative transmembrane protein 244 isoform X1 [Engystomops pustulosus]|uniref:putative transmembrane protein 244 isoform X1 n=1 Tax=Engystomops pustulosus TaxID=76066 RepID=UPI003AFB0B93
MVFIGSDFCFKKYPFLLVCSDGPQDQNIRNQDCATEFDHLYFSLLHGVVLSLLHLFHSSKYKAMCILESLDSLDERGPFDFKTQPSWSNKKYLANLISLETTFLVSSILFVLVVEEWIWDYGCTVAVIHITVTSVVNMEFPVMAHWWMSIGIGLTAMISGGEILAYHLYKNNFIYPDLEDF